MTRQKRRELILANLGNMGWPVILGLAACSLFYVQIYRGPLDTPVVLRYFASHPVAFLTTGMFFIGLAALLFKLLEVAGQLISIERIRLDPRSSKQSDRVDGGLLDAVQSLPDRLRRSYLGRRLHDALAFVHRRGAAEGLESELKELAAADANRQHESYALVRIIIWATPMLGFLGTVIGITQALGDLNPELLASEPRTAMEALLSGLYVAFDTTALALSLSIVLMFVQFAVDRMETQLLEIVDQRAGEELMDRFSHAETPSDPQMAALKRISDAVIRSTEQLVVRQTQLWQKSLDQAHSRWSEMTDSSAATVQQSLAQALDQSLQRHTQRLAQVHEDAERRLSGRWEQWQTTLSDNARLLKSQQGELARQSEMMLKVVQATSDVTKLEDALNRNLRSLAGAKNFEDTVISLSAAIHLLTTRLGGSPADGQDVSLREKESQGRAA